nr:DoxX family protein [Kibdelosporangium sp. MJ126-NF4]CEL16031.1 putative integral membrane protein [Kibdelosporangium sp. MJ126-NF4]CTQ93956.1 putative integral membrane protein [Kibdelosporangium sp. MJ126-NF4]
MNNVLRRREDLLSLFRIVVGFLFVCHGTTKLFGVPVDKVVAFGAWPNWYAAVIEVVAGTAVILGIGTRVAAVICSGEMAYAYFFSHTPRGLWPMVNGGELAAVYSWTFLLIAFFGPGAWTLARLWNKRKQTATTS